MTDDSRRVADLGIILSYQCTGNPSNIAHTYTSWFNPENTMTTVNHTYEDSIKELGFELTSWKMKVCVLAIMFVLGFIGNMVIFIMLLQKKLAVSTAIRHLIMNLVIADLFVVNFCILTLAIWHYTISWDAGDFMCRFSKFMQMFSLYASTFIIVVISIDRCVAIAAPLNTMGKRQLNQRLIMSAWILAGFFSIPQAIIFKVAKAPIPDVDFYQCVTYGSYTAPWQEPLYTTFTLFINFVIPLVTIILCYTLILYKLFTGGRLISLEGPRKEAPVTYLKEYPVLNSGRQISCNWNPSLTLRHAKLRKARTTSFWISMLIVMAFVVCWGPYYVRMVGSLFWWEKTTDEHVDNFVFFFGMGQSLINPLIYGAFHVLGKSRGMKRQHSSQHGYHNNQPLLSPHYHQDVVSAHHLCPHHHSPPQKTHFTTLL